MLKTNSKHIHKSNPDWLPKVTFLDFESLGISSEDDLPDYLPDDIKDKLQDGTYFKLDQYGDIIGVTSIKTHDFFDDEDDFFDDEEDEGDLDLSPEEGLIVDVDYVAELLQGLEPKELKYISKVCEVLIAEGEL